jgi:hypothetical protein
LHLRCYLVRGHLIKIVADVLAGLVVLAIGRVRPVADLREKVSHGIKALGFNRQNQPFDHAHRCASFS